MVSGVKLNAWMEVSKIKARAPRCSSVEHEKAVWLGYAASDLTTVGISWVSEYVSWL